MDVCTEPFVIHDSAIAEQVYYYKVMAVCDDNPDANSVYSVPVSRSCDLAVPTGVKVELSKAGKPVITWGSVEGADDYAVYMSTSENGEYTRIFRTAGNRMTHSAAEEGVTYYYKVRAVSEDNANAHSGYSAAVSATSN